MMHSARAIKSSLIVQIKPLLTVLTENPVLYL